MRQSIINKGVEVPEDVMIEDLPEYIAQINAGPSWDPENPTLEGLKAALDAGDYTAFPANTLIPDKYGDTDINWVVGQYGEATMADGTKKEGVYLFKDKALSSNQPFGSSGFYDQSPINTYLNGTYLNGCSESLKQIVGEIELPLYLGRNVNAKLWLMSVVEIMGVTTNNGEDGISPWEAWKLRTGLSSPTTGPSNGRVMKNESGSAVSWWTRSANSGSNVYSVDTNGSITQFAGISQSLGIVLALFIPKGGN